MWMSGIVFALLLSVIPKNKEEIRATLCLN
jgi:hypothetical protein